MAEGAVKNDAAKETREKKRNNQSNNAKATALKNNIPKLEGYAASGANVPLDEQNAIKNELKSTGAVSDQQILDKLFVNGKFNNSVYKTLFL